VDALLGLLMTKKRDCPSGITFVTTAYACPEGPMDSLCDSFGGSLKAFGYWGFKPSEGLVENLAFQNLLKKLNLLLYPIIFFSLMWGNEIISQVSF